MILHLHRPSVMVAEQGGGGQWSSITPPRTPRSSSGRRTRSRERRSPRGDQSGDDSEKIQQGWGPRIVLLERKVHELENSISKADVTISKRLTDGTEGLNAASARIDSLERTLPQRIHEMERQQTSLIATLNAVTSAINQKIESIEQTIASRPGVDPDLSFRAAPSIPPSFGGTAAQHYHMGSPLSAPPGISSNNTGANTLPDPWSQYLGGQHSQAATGSAMPASGSVPPMGATQHMAQGQRTLVNFDVRNWSASHAKVTKELKPFNGSDSNYRTWANRIRDHFTEVNADWGLVFAEIEKQKVRIPTSSQTLAYIHTNNNLSVQVDFRWVSSVLWTFIGKHVSDTLYDNRSTMTGGNDNNGVELWRAYFTKHEGGADQVELGGIGSLHTFPQCDKVEHLQHWIGKWTEVKDSYGQGVSDLHLRSMFINILPEHVKKDVREVKGLNCLQDYINHVTRDLGRLNDLKLSKLHADRLKQSLHPARSVHAIQGQEAEVPAPPKPYEDQFQSIINKLAEKVDGIAAVVQSGRTQPRGGTQQASRQDRPPSDFSKFKGCLHCGMENHRVRDCKAKQALLAKNGGKLPPGFKSAFNKWKANQPAKKVASLTDAELAEDFDNMSESDASDCMKALAISCNALPLCGSYSHPNSFAALVDNGTHDDDDDDIEMLNALSKLSSKITSGPKISQKKRVQRNQPMDKRSIASIAKQVREGKFNLPDLQLENNSDYDAGWALVDSGAGRSCAKRRVHFPNANTEITPSTVRMATANGEELKSRGCFKLDVLTAEGHTISQTFEDADVDMPIMAVTELAANGQLGSDIVFRKSDGAVVDIASNATSRFVRRRGVYFMKISVPKSGFTRPGSA